MQEEENNNVDSFPLDDAAIATVAELKDTIRSAQVALNAVLTYFARQHELKGEMQLAQNGREIIFKRTPKGAPQV
jgi:hypothetical protein